jgi:succinyl-diaminopimelate desuccinylase
MNGKQQILNWIEDDKERLIEFLQGFLRAKSPNPPGDTRLAANFVKHFLDKRQLEYRDIIAHPEMPNLVASFDGSGPGRHLVLNGHLDVFPVGEDETWTHGPWSGDVADGCIWGRGAVDMKCGTRHRSSPMFICIVSAASSKEG